MPHDETLTERFEGHTPEPWHLTVRDGQPEHGAIAIMGRSWQAIYSSNASGNPEADARLAVAAPTLLRERDEARRALDRANLDFDTVNDHLADCQEELLKHGTPAGADGSVVVGVARLAEERNEARAALDAVKRERDALAEALKAALRGHAVCSLQDGGDGKRYHFGPRPSDLPYTADQCWKCMGRAALAKAGRGA
jgi:hypothetical protein